jgi:Tol biopolymer transport system component
LQRGALPLDDALEVAAQVARALEAAHAQGIVHRDLKPANIVCAESGAVKVLDFGLAKALATDPASGQTDAALSPTLTSAGTRVGMILGTAGYMSPEQARGKPADARADLWALGAVLMEMITGKQVFGGETVSDTLASVLKSEPDWSLLSPATPRPLRRLLRRCLRKDPDSRLHHPADARIEIEAARSRPDPVESAGAEAAVVAADPAWKRVLTWALAGIALVAVVGLAVRELGRPELPQPVGYRFDLSWEAEGALPEIAPGGRRFAWIKYAGGTTTLQIRGFDEPEGRQVAELSPDRADLVWSPDGESLAYFTETSLETIRVDNGTSATWCTIPPGWRSGTWSATGSFLFDVAINPEADGWYVCRPDSTTAEKIERPIPLETGQIKAWPEFLLDGEHFVFVQHLDGVKQAILGKLDSKLATPMFPTDGRVRVAGSGWYLYGNKGQLLARRFDPSTFLADGESVKVADRVDLFEPNGRVRFSVSDQGTVMYVTGEHVDDLVWFDRTGRALGPAVDPGEYNDWRLSPDGRLLALVINDPKSGTGDLWVHDLTRGSTNRVTGTTFSEFSPVWSPDGSEIVYSADPEGPPHVFVVGVDGGEPRVLVPFDGKVHYTTDWSGALGKIAFNRQDELLVVDAAGEEPESTVLSGGGAAVFSPDGRWVAYTTRETGRSEVYVQPFGRPGSRQRVSVETGWSARWDGNDRLLYRSRPERLMAVTLRPDGDRLAIGKPEILIDFGDTDVGGFDLHPDGRILVRSHAAHEHSEVVKVAVGWR